MPCDIEDGKAYYPFSCSSRNFVAFVFGTIVRQKGRCNLMQVINQTRGCTLAEHGWFAENPFTRMVGLLGKRRFPEGGALILRPCSGIHMLGMRFAIDALYLDARGRVVRAVRSLAPWRIGPLDPTTECVIEMPAGTINASGTVEGDEITLS